MIPVETVVANVAVLVEDVVDRKIAETQSRSRIECLYATDSLQILAVKVLYRMIAGPI